MKRNLLIAHGGGPTPVINASLYGAVREAVRHNCFGKILGAVHGIEGVFNERFVDFREASGRLELLPQTPSSAIGSCRRKLKDEDYPLILERLKKHAIGYFLYNGGNDSMDTCAKMEELARLSGYDLVVTGVPKTIDNDLERTDHCPGYGSAARFLAANVRDLRCEERALPLYPMIVETMGRNAGWLAAAASLAEINGRPCADLIYLPECAFDKARFLADMDNSLSRSRAVLAVVCEGLAGADGRPVADTGFVDGFGHGVPGGTAQALAAMVLQELGVQTRYEKLGLAGRASGVWQSPVDREEAIEAGRQAVRLLAAGESGYMVTIRREADRPYACGYGRAPLTAVANLEKRFPLAWINDARNGVCGGFEAYCRPLLGGEFTPYADLGID